MHIKRGTAKVRGSLYELVFRALGSSRLRGMTPADQTQAANHIARKLGGAYVKTKQGWEALVEREARKHADVFIQMKKRIESMEDEMAGLRMRAAHSARPEDVGLRAKVERYVKATLKRGDEWMELADSTDAGREWKARRRAIALEKHREKMDKLRARRGY